MEPLHMHKIFLSFGILFSAASASAEPAIFVLPVQSEIPFLTQMPGTNIFVGPGAASIVAGKVVINGKEYKKFPEPPVNPPDWANGMKERIDREISTRKDLRLAPSKSKARFILRTILTRFGKGEDGSIGVTYEGAILDGKTEEVVLLLRAAAEEPRARKEPENLSWPNFTALEKESSLGIANRRAVEKLVTEVSKTVPKPN